MRANDKQQPLGWSQTIGKIPLWSVSVTRVNALPMGIALKSMMIGAFECAALPIMPVVNAL